MVICCYVTYQLNYIRPDLRAILNRYNIILHLITNYFLLLLISFYIYLYIYTPENYFIIFSFYMKWCGYAVANR